MYKSCLAVASRQMRLIGVNSIGGKDPHDFAIDALRATGHELKRVRLDIIDAIRHEIGRDHKTCRDKKTGELKTWKGKGRKYQQIPLDWHRSHPIAAQPTEDPEWFKPWANILGPRQRFVAIMLSQGVEKKDIAKVLGCSASNVSIICNQIAWAMRRNLEKEGKLR